MPRARRAATRLLPQRITNGAGHGVLGSPLRQGCGVRAEQGASESCRHRAAVASRAPSEDPLLPTPSRGAEPTRRRSPRLTVGDRSLLTGPTRTRSCPAHGGRLPRGFRIGVEGSSVHFGDFTTPCTDDYRYVRVALLPPNDDQPDEKETATMKLTTT